MKKVDTFTATIYVGRKYRYNGKHISLRKTKKIIQEYVDAVGLCVTVTPTEYIYKNGREKGVTVGLINYPRFPSTEPFIKEQAIELAGLLLKGCRQMRVSVVFPDETVMLSAEGAGE